MLLMIRLTLLCISLLILLIGGTLALSRPDHVEEMFIYAEVDAARNQEDFYLIQPDTGHVERLFTKPSWFEIMGISRDRRSLLIADTSIQYSSLIYQLYLHSIKGGEEQRLATDFIYGTEAISQDGRWLVFAEYEYSPGLMISVTNLYRVREDGQGKQPVIRDHFLYIQDVVWSPDGHSIVVVATNVADEYGIWRVNIGSGVVEQITDLSPSYINGVTPQGLLFSTVSQSDLETYPFYLYEWDSHEVIHFIDVRGRFIGMSANEQKFYFSETLRAADQESSSIVEIAIDNSREIRGIYRGGSLASILLTNKWIFLMDRGNMIRITLDNSSITPMQDASSGTPIYLSQDGKWLYYHTGNYREQTLHRIHLDSQQSQQITVNGGWYANLLPYDIPELPLPIMRLWVIGGLGMIASGIRLGYLRSLL